MAEEADNLCDHANPANARFCEICGRPTDYFLKGLMKPWEEVETLVAANEEPGLIM